MAIRIIQGKIGSGKTYYAVNHVLNSWYKWCDNTDSWVLKSTDIDVRVYTNIQNMKLGNSLDDVIKNAGGLTNFFNMNYQENFCRNSNVIYIIDEAQGGNYFHRKFYDVNVFLFFQMHRHLGVDIYLITQDSRCLSRELQNLAEFSIRSIRRSNSIGKSFTYKFYSGDECFKTKRITKDKKVFGMYRSMVIGEGEKIKSIPLKHILYFVGMVVVAGFIFKFGFMNILYRMNKKPGQDPQQEIVKSILPDSRKTFDVLKNDNMYDIVGTVGDQYIVKTDKGLKRVKIKSSDNKGIGDQIKIEKL